MSSYVSNKCLQSQEILQVWAWWDKSLSCHLSNKCFKEEEILQVWTWWLCLLQSTLHEGWRLQEDVHCLQWESALQYLCSHYSLQERGHVQVLCSSCYSPSTHSRGSHGSHSERVGRHRTHPEIHALEPQEPTGGPYSVWCLSRGFCL